MEMAEVSEHFALAFMLAFESNDETWSRLRV